MKIVVLAGGLSPERNVSLSTGTMVTEALRALGHGRRVVILQFLKDGSSGEIEMLRRCGAAVYACHNAKFTWLMTEEERASARQM